MRAGLTARREGRARLRVTTAAGQLLIKPVTLAHLEERACFPLAPFDHLVLHAGGRAFAFGGRQFEALRIQPELRALDDPLQALEVRELYTHAARVVCLRPPLDLEALVASSHVHWDRPRPDTHPEHGQPPLDRAVDAFWRAARPLCPADEAGLRKGAFHEDLQVGNLLRAEGGPLHVIDPDPIWHAPAVLNLAHFFVMEIFGRQRADRFEALRAALLDVLEEERPRDFDFFVLLALFRALVRRAFHVDHFHDRWCEDLVWFFERFSEDYLGRVGR